MNPITEHITQMEIKVIIDGVKRLVGEKNYIVLLVVTPDRLATFSDVSPPRIKVILDMAIRDTAIRTFSKKIQRG